MIDPLQDILKRFLKTFRPLGEIAPPFGKGLFAADTPPFVKSFLVATLITLFLSLSSPFLGFVFGLSNDRFSLGAGLVKITPRLLEDQVRLRANIRETEPRRTKFVVSDHFRF
jgi:hypothetical protein